MLNNRKKTIGVFVCKLLEYFQRTLCGALADEAVANGYNLVVFSTFGEYDNNHDYVEGESNCLYIPNYDELDGIIFFHWMMKDLMQFYVPMIIWQFLYVKNCAIEDSVYRRILL